jgi:hypothetical protein
MRVLRQHRRQPRGSKPAPVEKGKPTQLPDLIGQKVELFLQGDPLAQDEFEVGLLTYITPTWIGFVSTFRAQRFYDHIPVTSVRKIRGVVTSNKQPRHQRDPFEGLDLDNPTKVTDLINEEVTVHLQGNQLLRDSAFKTRLVYVKKNWIGVRSTFSNRVLPDHIPISSVRKVTKTELLATWFEGRFKKRR